MYIYIYIYILYLYIKKKNKKEKTKIKITQKSWGQFSALHKGLDKLESQYVERSYIVHNNAHISTGMEL